VLDRSGDRRPRPTPTNGNGAIDAAAVLDGVDQSEDLEPDDRRCGRARRRRPAAADDLASGAPVTSSRTSCGEQREPANCGNSSSPSFNQRLRRRI